MYSIFNDKDLKVNGINDKDELFDFLLKLSEQVKEKYINKINDRYGYDYIDIYELNRYRIKSLNTQPTEHQHTPVMFEYNCLKLDKGEYENAMNSLQKGYMSMLANNN